MAFNPQFRSSRKRNIISEINITPMVDVLLVLLIIFIVAAPMMNSKVDVNLPQGSSKENKKTETNSIIISIKANGELFLQDSPISISNLPSSLNIITANNHNNSIFIRADKSLGYGKVMEVVKKISQAGFEQVVLLTEINQ